MERVKRSCTGSGQGTLWWMGHELEEAKKYMVCQALHSPDVDTTTHKHPFTHLPPTLAEPGTASQTRKAEGECVNKFIVSRFQFYN